MITLALFFMAISCILLAFVVGLYEHSRAKGRRRRREFEAALRNVSTFEQGDEMR